MLQMRINLNWHGSAEGWYSVSAKGYCLAVLHWGDAEQAFCDWSPFAFVPLDPAGNGSFYFSGNRGIPRGASHVWAKMYSYDFASMTWISTKIPEEYLSKNVYAGDERHFSVLTDIHMVQKPWRLRKALRRADGEAIFLLGDSTNDGFAEQFERVKDHLNELAGSKCVFPVSGNHDVIRASRGDESDGCANYVRFQNELLLKARENGVDVETAPDGRAYAVRTGNLDIVGLQCVTSGRKFLFEGGVQIDWLEKHLAETAASWHIILCHAPLLRHNPNRNEGAPYLHHDKRIQEILNRTGRVIFLSGHTHVSPNTLVGSGAMDREHGNIYLDCASVVATDTAGIDGMMNADWKDGIETELRLSQNTVEIIMRSIDTGIRFSRGYYFFQL